MRTRLICICCYVILGCSTPGNEKLPILGIPEVVAKEINGKIVPDTIYHSIRPFSFVNQEGSVITNESFDDRIYVADFFFTSCPSICPVMKTQMLRVYERFIDEPDVLFLSHTIDPVHDSVAVLKDFAERLNVSPDKWHFVTGDKGKIFEIAQVSYMSVAAEDGNAPGGYIHSGRFLLVDKERRIRGAYDGTSAEDVSTLITDINVLLAEYAQQ